MLSKLCPPALIYLIFSTTQIVIDTIKGFYNTAFLKLWVTFAFTVLLNFLCSRGLGIVSWIIVFIPFILMTLIISILLIMFGLDPATGRSKIYQSKKFLPGATLKPGYEKRKHRHWGKHKRGKKRHGGWGWGKKVKPRVFPKNDIQKAYDKDMNKKFPGQFGPNGKSRGPESEWIKKKGGDCKGGVDVNGYCVTWVGKKGKSSWHDGGKGKKHVKEKCGTFCGKDRPCNDKCRDWKCSNCIPPAPANLSSKCKKASPDCRKLCTPDVADLCLHKHHLRPECKEWAPCMVLNRKNQGLPEGFKHGIF